MEEPTTIAAYTYPDKPKIDEADSSSMWKSFGSVILFIVAYYMFFDKDINHILVLVLVLFIHELGHFLAMKYFNYTDVKMFFIPLLGALVSGNKEDISQKQKAIILLAGPAPGIIMGLVLYYIGFINGQQSLISTANIFIFLNIFNLLPFKPLDGGNLIGVLFFDKKETIQLIFGIVSACVFGAVAIYSESYILIIVPGLLITGIIQKYESKRIKEYLRNDNIDYNKPFDDLTNEEYWKIRDHVVYNVAGFSRINAKEYVVSKREKQIIDYIKSLVEKSPTYDLSVLAKILFLLTWILFLFGPIIILALIVR